VHFAATALLVATQHGAGREEISFVALMFETMSALATVGLLIIGGRDFANSPGEFGGDDQRVVLELLSRIDSVLGVLGEEQEQMLDPEIEANIEERNSARRNRNFDRADQIRKELAARGITLEDTPQGTKWKRK